ncbi:unnamed protein product, partial [marine sediment metagenome]
MRVGDGRGEAAGVKVADGYILTAWHVVPGGRGSITWYDGQTATATRATGSQREDWAIFKIEPARPAIHAYELASAPAIKGEPLCLAGFPGGRWSVKNLHATGNMG